MRLSGVNRLEWPFLALAAGFAQAGCHIRGKAVEASNQKTAKNRENVIFSDLACRMQNIHVRVGRLAGFAICRRRNWQRDVTGCFPDERRTER